MSQRKKINIQKLQITKSIPKRQFQIKRFDLFRDPDSEYIQTLIELNGATRS